LALARLQENVELDRKKVMAKVFVQDPFNPTWFLEDSEKYVDVKRIMCILTSYKDHQDVLELKEQELTLLQDEIQGFFPLTKTHITNIASRIANVTRFLKRRSQERPRNVGKEDVCQLSYLYKN